MSVTAIKSIGCLLIIAISSQSLSGQDDSLKQRDSGPVGIFADRDEYHQFMGQLKRIDDPQVQEMVPFINDLVLEKEIGFTNQKYNLNSGGVVDLLGDKRVRKELEMIDSQYEELKERADDIQKEMAEKIRSLDFTNSEELASSIHRITESAESGLKDLLLPHQLKRIQQLSLRIQMRERSLVDIITSEPVATTLRVSAEQKVDLRAAEKKINDQLQQQIAELRRKARKKLLLELTLEQREQLGEMLGEEFDFGIQQSSGVRKRK